MSKPLVLIVDDDARNVFALNAVLKARGYRTLAATSAQDGIKLLQEHDDIGAVLMDMMMPEMDGYEAIAAIKADDRLRDIPVIAVTAQAMVGDREKCLEAGADDYIPKPVDITVLERILNRYCEQV